MSAAICTVCDGPWRPDCREHLPVAFRGYLMRPRCKGEGCATGLTAVAKGLCTHCYQRQRARRLSTVAAALARNPSLAKRYGLEREP